MNLGKLQEMVRDREAWRATVHGVKELEHDWVTEQEQQRCTGFKLKPPATLAPNKSQPIL